MEYLIGFILGDKQQLFANRRTDATISIQWGIAIQGTEATEQSIRSPFVAPQYFSHI